MLAAAMFFTALTPLLSPYAHAAFESRMGKHLAGRS
jgi:hypothetical protein